METNRRMPRQRFFATKMFLLFSASPCLVPTGAVQARHRAKRACARHGLIVGHCATLSSVAPQRPCARCVPPSMSEDHYATLGLERGTTTAQIKDAYRKLALRMHPDVNDAPEAEELFASLTEAYSVLGDASRRATYDNTILGNSRAVEDSYRDSYADGKSRGGGSGAGFWVNTDVWDEPDVEWRKQDWEDRPAGLDDYDTPGMDLDGIFVLSLAIFTLVVSLLGAQGDPSATAGDVEWCGLLSCAGMEDAGFGPLM